MNSDLGSFPLPEDVQNAVAIMRSIEAQIGEIDIEIEIVNQKYLAVFNPLAEKRGRLVYAWQSLNAILPDLTMSSDGPPVPEVAKAQEPRAFARGEKATPRSIMLNMLRSSIGAVSAEALWGAVQAAGLKTKMTGPELVYQTLYHARKHGHPVDRNADGAWFWVREDAA